MYAYSQNNSGGSQRSNRCRSRARYKNGSGQSCSSNKAGSKTAVSSVNGVSFVGGEGVAIVAGGDLQDVGTSSRSSTDVSKRRVSFTPQHQKAIIEHLLLTKNSTPQKNYSHVPCKFYRQGACQAGSSCPFSHSLNVLTADQTPCKYFEKGNCKFGVKCVNAHILPDGTRANPPKQILYPSTSSSAVVKNSMGAVTLPGSAQGAVTGGSTRSMADGEGMQLQLQQQQIQQQIQQQQQQIQQQQQLHHHRYSEPDISMSQRQYVGYAGGAFTVDGFTQNKSLSDMQYVSNDLSSSGLASGTPLLSPYVITTNSMNNQGLGPPPPALPNPPFGDELDTFEGEVLVPSELSDLLTPKELKRRNSRPSSTSRKVSFSDNISTPSTTSSEPYTFMHRRTWSSASATTPPPTMMDQMASSSSSSFISKIVSANYTYQDTSSNSAQGKSPWNNISSTGNMTIYNGGLFNPAVNTPTGTANCTEYQLRHLTEDLTKFKIYEEESTNGSESTISPTRQEAHHGPTGHIRVHQDHSKEAPMLFDDFQQGIY
ncbi:Lee1p Ecym_2562 [Eremothecium cymbalariae DBVPG|uniref:C3H1-type domain-containing protein n=1 Tax=Eremothecium cymbalariae (strain CBS 270.75 / DBVPG 7215 / KCTC 17166 / NRRL Y-17582) TaxID=931890 RepID=G8JQC3_ERECY|nr:Hypothetical protein Ecym_2562 [Eremothecium cymbalariae DBVPG\